MGKWIKTSDGDFVCDRCHARAITDHEYTVRRTSYCHACGAEMEPGFMYIEDLTREERLDAPKSDLIDYILYLEVKLSEQLAVNRALTTAKQVIDSCKNCLHCRDDYCYYYHKDAKVPLTKEECYGWATSLYECI